LFVVFLPHLFFPFRGVVFFAGFFLVAWSDCSELLFLPCGVGGFCLESLILAQDERWRRA
jgi:hypothetical protein